MKKLLMIAAAVAAFAVPAHAQDVRMGTEGAYAPWNYVNENGKVDGFDIAVGNELCKRAGLTCTWVTNEWDTIIPNLQAGNYDAIMAAMTITPEREKTIMFSDDYYPPDPSLFVVKEGSSVDANNLKGLKIGVQGATIQADWANQNLAADNSILSYETADQAIADLTAGNVDVVLADGGYVKPLVAGSNGAFKVVGDGVAIGGGIGIGLRKSDTELKAKFDKAISEMKADGSLNAMIKKWFDDPTLF